jgi:hypothetical protein
MKNVLLFSSLLLLVFACRKTPDVNCDKPTNEMTASRKLIKGTWIWKSERVYIRALQKILIKTPETEGYTRQIVFQDSTITFYKNDSLFDAYVYSIDFEYKGSLYALDSTPVLLLRKANSIHYTNYVHHKICPDSLFLNWSIRSDIKGNEVWYKK